MLAVESKRLHHTDRHSNVILQSMLIKCFKIGFTKWEKSAIYVYIIFKYGISMVCSITRYYI